jgi:hypothetical protein
MLNIGFKPGWVSFTPRNLISWLRPLYNHIRWHHSDLHNFIPALPLELHWNERFCSSGSAFAKPELKIGSWACVSTMILDVFLPKTLATWFFFLGLDKTRWSPLMRGRRGNSHVDEHDRRRPCCYRTIPELEEDDMGTALLPSVLGWMAMGGGWDPLQPVWGQHTRLPLQSST